MLSWHLVINYNNNNIDYNYEKQNTNCLASWGDSHNYPARFAIFKMFHIWIVPFFNSYAALTSWINYNNNNIDYNYEKQNIIV